jgi:nucleoside-diphosphate-sugar epimerase
MSNENELKQVACVTGATGMIGGIITQKLLKSGFHVRILSRDDKTKISNTELFIGDLRDEVCMGRFLANSQLLFHCAAELNDESQMWEVNVKGTELLIKLAGNLNLKYFCYLSSVGVTGHTNEKLINEKTVCNPGNTYEKSKWAGEQLVRKGIKGCKVIILRPTNVVDDAKPGTLGFVSNASWKNRLKIFLKGAECAHVVHAEDVASAAMYFVQHKVKSPSCFIVSYDQDQYNTYSDLFSLSQALKVDKFSSQNDKPKYLPLVFPYLVRKLTKGSSNWGDVRYSSAKLVAEGFSFEVGIINSLKRIICRL